MLFVGGGRTDRVGQTIPTEVFHSIYSKVPRLTVDTILRNSQGIVLSKRNIDPGSGLWHIPGGTMLRPETLLDTAARVTKRETGLEVGNLTLIGVIEYEADKDAVGQSVSIVFLTSPIGGRLQADSEAQEIGIFSPDRLPEPIIPEVKEFIARVFKNGLFAN